MKTDCGKLRLRRAYVIAALTLIDILAGIAADYTLTIFLVVVEAYAGVALYFCRKAWRFQNRHWFFRFNLWFVLIAAIIFGFCYFPYFGEVEEIIRENDLDMAPTVHFSRIQFAAIERHPAAYLVICILYYSASLRIPNIGRNNAINTLLMFYIPLLLLGLGAPFMEALFYRLQ